MDDKGRLIMPSLQPGGKPFVGKTFKEIEALEERSSRKDRRAEKALNRKRKVPLNVRT